MKTLYLHFYKDIGSIYIEQLNWAQKVGIPMMHPKSIESLFRHDGTRQFIEQYIVFGSQLYFKFLEIKSKEAREEWGREAVHHSRNIKNLRYGGHK